MWKPLTEVPTSPDRDAMFQRLGIDQPNAEVTTWRNDLYQVLRYEFADGLTWLSIKRIDREPIRDWRHMQQMKNELCGDERYGLEIYPPESVLVDSSNQYHLWVLPEGVEMPLGYHERLVLDPEQAVQQGAKQRPWEEGLTTGSGERTRLPTE